MKPDSLIKDVKHYFEFLYNKGYKIRYADHPSQFSGNWVVELESSDCIIYITSEQDYLHLAFSPVKNADRKKRFSIGTMIYFLSGGNNFMGPFEGNTFWGKKKQFTRLAGLLKEYIDQITPCFGEDFEKYKSDILCAEEKYNNLGAQMYARKLKGLK